MIGSNLLNLATNVIWLEPRDRRSECLSVALEVQARQPGLNVLVLLAFMSDFPPETFSDRSTDAVTQRRGMRVETNRTSRFSRLRCPRMHRVADSAVSAVVLPKRQLQCGLLQVRTRSAHGKGDFGAQYMAYVTLQTDA